MDYDVKDLSLAPGGKQRIEFGDGSEWARRRSSTRKQIFTSHLTARDTALELAKRPVDNSSTQVRKNDPFVGTNGFGLWRKDTKLVAALRAPDARSAF